MSHYEERLQRDLTAIRKQIATLGEEVGKAVKNSAIALLTVDNDLAVDTILGDLRINRLGRELDTMCHRFVALHLPSAGNLRYVSSALRLSIALERIGDYAETISRSACQLGDKPPATVARDIDMMADQGCRLLRASLKAFDSVNSEMARGALELAGQFAPTFDKVFADLITEAEARTRPVAELFALIATFNRLERVIHQAKNICEEAIFADTGETKKPKRFNILFIGDDNSGLSQVAERYATKVYGDRATFSSVGLRKGGALSPEYSKLAVELGVDLKDAEPRALTTVLPDIDSFQILIDLTGQARAHISPIPFHTILLNWKVDAPEQRRDSHKEIVAKLSHLMDKLSGEAT